MQGQKNSVDEKHCWCLCSSTFAPTQGPFYRTLRSIWCFAGCNWKGRPPPPWSLMAPVQRSAHLNFIMLFMLLEKWWVTLTEALLGFKCDCYFHCSFLLTFLFPWYKLTHTEWNLYLLYCWLFTIFPFISLCIRFLPITHSYHIFFVLPKL